jgi:hypothetical protein
LCPNPTPKQAEKAKAYAARDAWTLLDDVQQPEGGISITLLSRKRIPLGPYRGPIPRVLVGALGE